LGLPVAEDLPGRILFEAIRLDLLKQSPPKQVLRYAPPPSIPSTPLEEAVDREVLKRLRALGYL